MNPPITKTDPGILGQTGYPPGRLDRPGPPNQPGPRRGPVESLADPGARPKALGHDRLVAAGVALLAGAVLAVAAGLTPDPSGTGTHRQLGLPACSSQLLAGRPCPSCGMTTAFAWFVRGDLAAALRTQVLGTILAAVTLLAALGGGVMAVTGTDFGPFLRRVFVERLDWIYLLIGLGLASWMLKMKLG